jgi:hypothetical protein
MTPIRYYSVLCNKPNDSSTWHVITTHDVWTARHAMFDAALRERGDYELTSFLSWRDESLLQNSYLLN